MFERFIFLGAKCDADGCEICDDVTFVWTKGITMENFWIEQLETK